MKNLDAMLMWFVYAIMLGVTIGGASVIISLGFIPIFIDVTESSLTKIVEVSFYCGSIIGVISSIWLCWDDFKSIFKA